MASSSAAERSQSDPALRNKRGQQVVLTFSQQVRAAVPPSCTSVRRAHVHTRQTRRHTRTLGLSNRFPAHEPAGPAALGALSAQRRPIQPPPPAARPTAAIRRPQGMGNLVNGCVILIVMAMLGQTGHVLDPTASRNIIIIQVGVDWNGRSMGWSGVLRGLLSGVCACADDSLRVRARGCASAAAPKRRSRESPAERRAGAAAPPLGPAPHHRLFRVALVTQFAVAAAVSVFMTVWRYTKLKESKARGARGMGQGLGCGVWCEGRSQRAQGWG
jgi:hypothetical protein